MITRHPPPAYLEANRVEELPVFHLGQAHVLGHLDPPLHPAARDLLLGPERRVLVV